MTVFLKKQPKKKNKYSEHHAAPVAAAPREGVSAPDAVELLVNNHMSRTNRIGELRPLLAALKSDVAATAVLKVHESALGAFFSEAVGRQSVMNERTFLKQLSDAALMRGVIVPLPGGDKAAEVRCDLHWLDASGISGGTKCGANR